MTAKQQQLIAYLNSVGTLTSMYCIISMPGKIQFQIGFTNKAHITLKPNTPGVYEMKMQNIAGTYDMFYIQISQSEFMDIQAIHGIIFALGSNANYKASTLNPTSLKVMEYNTESTVNKYL